MLTRRSTLLFLSLTAVTALAAPLWTQSASAKDNGKGNGNNSGNNGNGNGGRGGKGGAKSNGTANTKSPAAAVVKHSNGLEESVVRGRYIMKDNKGRIIVNRRASRADRERLESLQR